MFKIACFILFTLIPFHSFCQENLKLWYTKPAKTWTDALPLGNGRIGAMVFGRVDQELIQLNESSLWTGGPVRTNVNPQAYDHLLLARKALLADEDYAKAYGFAKKMQGYYSESYLPLADLSITQDFGTAAPAGYYRELDIANAISTTRFTVNGIKFTRQTIISTADQVMIIHLTASKKSSLSLKIGISSQLKYQFSNNSSDEIILSGRAPAHIQPDYLHSENPIEWDDSRGCKGMRFELIMKAMAIDGSVKADSGSISVKDCTELTVVISAATSFNGFNKCPFSEGKNEKQIAESFLKKAITKKWEQLLRSHLADYHKYFNRVSFSLKPAVGNNNASLPTDQRLISYAEGAKDPGLETLYFQYGRYLLISCSRTPGIPANLQGIWNKEMRPPWSANYTTNINLEMNYWAAEQSNLSEMHMPLIEFIQNAAVTGTRTAREFYHTRGWAVHHNSDIWALSNPVGDLGNGDPMWANWTMGSPWLSQHLWWHYQFTQDKKYLKDTAYPLMKTAAQFCLDFLVPYDNHLVTAPSFSPENTYIDFRGDTGSISVATTMDMSIVRDLFNHVMEASRILGTDSLFRDSIIAVKEKLYPLQIGKAGNLQEWYKDFKDTDPHHRHISHLFTLFPGSEISVIKTPALAEAAKKTLELRGDEGTGWSLAWKINFWARLLDGNHAYRMLKDLLRPTGLTGIKYSGGGGSYINLFDAHPPFQIDGNFGGLSGMIEMLLQSQNGEIYLLPALPDAWPEGKISGLKARGNFEVSIQWQNKGLHEAEIYAVTGGPCTLRTRGPIRVEGQNAQSLPNAGGYVTVLATKKGARYKIFEKIVR